MKFLNFFLLLSVIFALLDPDSEYGSGSTDLIESGSSRDPDPDPQPCFLHRHKRKLKWVFLRLTSDKLKFLIDWHRTLYHYSTGPRCGSDRKILYLPSISFAVPHLLKDADKIIQVEP
jgi:hypothetical protein